MYFVSHPIVRDGLLQYLDAASPKSFPGTGTTWYDMSGNNNHATVTNGPTFNTANGGVLNLDGVDDYINTNLNLSGYTNLTIEIWLYDTKSTGQRDLLTYNDNAGAFTFTNLTALRTDGNGMAARNYSGLTIPSTSWYHFCYIKNTSVSINNTTYTGTGTDNPYGVLKIGNTRSDINNRFSGKIASLKIYTKVLSAAEIAQNFNAHKSRFGL